MEKNNRMVLFCIVAVILSFACSFEEVRRSNNSEMVGNEEKSWLEVTDGLNFKAQCKNPSCPSHGNPVYVKVGKIEYPIKHSKYQVDLTCPACNEKIDENDLDALGFSHCSFKVKIRRHTNDSKLLKEGYWQRTTGDDVCLISKKDFMPVGKAVLDELQILYLGESEAFPDEDE